ncbi:hypothetical protein G5C51_22555 [Streptomyces sp. A7024]|uniref:Uncharacterized protein n=1 Tax=Streptomyces coryli TaxID=1128680 RepID=A0A6G4U3T6_9ACTN|nr:hypothetical protein [Streptomyces coryli]NGN66672.1 hypothetical protein [Streptomyces coryli]
MKPLLWLVLIAAVSANVFLSLVADGLAQTLLSIATGVVAIGTALGLWAVRSARSARSA